MEGSEKNLDALRAQSQILHFQATAVGMLLGLPQGEEYMRIPDRLSKLLAQVEAAKEADKNTAIEKCKTEYEKYAQKIHTAFSLEKMNLKPFAKTYWERALLAQFFLKESLSTVERARRILIWTPILECQAEVAALQKAYDTFLETKSEEALLAALKEIKMEALLNKFSGTAALKSEQGKALWSLSETLDNSLTVRAQTGYPTSIDEAALHTADEILLDLAARVDEERTIEESSSLAGYEKFFAELKKIIWELKSAEKALESIQRPQAAQIAHENALETLLDKNIDTAKKKLHALMIKYVEKAKEIKSGL